MKFCNALFLLSLLMTPALATGASTEVLKQAFKQAESLVELWGAEHSFEPSLTGTLRIDAQGNASIAGRMTTVQTEGDQIKLTLPRDEGAFRGRFVDDRERIIGHWIQAPGIVENYQFATPMILERTATGSWQGQVVPFQEQLKVYLLINKEPDGVVSVVMRNPERNIGVNFRLDHVAVRDDRADFYNYDGDIVLSGVLRFAQSEVGEQAKVTSFSVPLWGGKTFDFTRRARDEASGFYPRQTLSRYNYTPPRQDADGWPVANARAVGVSEQALEAFVQQILDTPINSHRSPYIQDVVIARKGKLILEEHFFGYHGDIPHDSRSAGKSITSMLAGAAVAEGALEIDDLVYDWYPESIKNPDPRKAGMTVQHLLTMSSGYACDDNNPDSPGNEGNMQNQSGQRDWFMFTLDLPMIREPGEKGVYCSGGMNLVAGVVSRSTKQWLPDFFQTRFALPLGIENYHINLDPLGRGYGGGGIRLTPRDFIKFGQIMLDGGVWRGERILPEFWVRDSLTPHSSINVPDDYGYAWWRAEHTVGDRHFESWSATGNGGQLIVIVPHFDLVVAFNGGNYNNYPTWIAWRDELVPALIESAIE